MIFTPPVDIPHNKRDTYIHNLETVTGGTGRLFLFAGDQKVEHLNKDFVGSQIAPEDASPQHLFRIAAQAKIGAFAAQLGLIAEYGADAPHVPYIVKLNAKTDIVPVTQKDPYSATWTRVEDVLTFQKNSKLHIAGVGYTIYPGSIYESEMLATAAQHVFAAHQAGLIAVIWAYPRGEAVKDERDPHLTAGVAGIAAAMGADYVKINPPKGGNSVESATLLKEAVAAAGRTKVICAGGASMDEKTFLQTLHDQIHIGGAMGNATGRNVHQRPLDEAVKLCNAIYAVTVENASVDQALRA